MRKMHGDAGGVQGYMACVRDAWRGAPRKNDGKVCAWGPAHLIRSAGAAVVDGVSTAAARRL